MKNRTISPIPTGIKKANVDWKSKLQEHQQSNWSPTALSPKEEMEFKQWMMSNPWFQNIQKLIEKENKGPVPADAVFENVINKHADYDYRGAWKDKAAIKVDQYDGQLHWPSMSTKGKALKSPNHPTAWKEFFMRQYGEDPSAIGLRSVQDAIRWENTRGSGIRHMRGK